MFIFERVIEIAILELLPLCNFALKSITHNTSKRRVIFLATVWMRNPSSFAHVLRSLNTML